MLVRTGNSLRCGLPARRIILGKPSLNVVHNPDMFSCLVITLPRSPFPIEAKSASPEATSTERTIYP
ncbi:hypothetical protein [Mangrovibacter phragmitis]|uniref:hypothetical protein n=1 Tax=Mangrovibacter phragmitis TaxID=1691903 RepID=UPI00351572E8